MRRRSPAEDGATLVEAAFALPVFFLLVLGLVDFGLFGLNSTQAGNAARDGVRVAAIGYLKADEQNSTDWNAVKAAIDQNLPGRSVGGDITLQVRCIDVQTGNVQDCEHPDIDVGIDKINVRVTWSHSFVSPVAQALGFKSQAVDGDATSVIIGAPIAGGATGNQPCSLTGVTEEPDPVDRYASGAQSGTLYDDLEIVVSGSGLCPNLEVAVTDASGASAVVCSGGCIGTHSYAGDASDFWTAGTATVTVTDGGGESSPVSATFEVQDDAPPPCNITSVTVSPDPVQRVKNGNKAGELKSDLTITIQGTGSCTGMTATLTTPAPTSTIVNICSGSCLGGFVYLKDAGNYWETGTATVAVSASSGDAESTTFTVQDEPDTGGKP